MFSGKQKMEIEVHGQRFAFKVDEAEKERLLRAVEIVESGIKELEQEMKNPSTLWLAIAVALRLADNWLALSDDREHNLELVRSTVTDVLEILEGELGDADGDGA